MYNCYKPRICIYDSGVALWGVPNHTQCHFLHNAAVKHQVHSEYLVFFKDMECPINRMSHHSSVNKANLI